MGHILFSAVFVCLSFLHCCTVPGKNVTKSPKKQPECRNCHQPFLLDHQCDENYYWDDVDEFGNDSDGSDDLAT